MTGTRIFEDRIEAGRDLADALKAKGYDDPVVLALPRGGVPLAKEIADTLEAPLDLLFVRKIGVPSQPELAVGAVVDGTHPETVINEDVRAMAHVTGSYLEEATDAALAEIERRRSLYLKGRAPVLIEGRTAIVVDDGIATGATVRAALKGLRNRKPAKLVLAVAVAPPETVERLRVEVDDLVCLSVPETFFAISMFYRSFPQVSDDEVIALLAPSKST